MAEGKGNGVGFFLPERGSSSGHICSQNRWFRGVVTRPFRFPLSSGRSCAMQNTTPGRNHHPRKRVENFLDQNQTIPASPRARAKKHLLDQHTQRDHHNAEATHPPTSAHGHGVWPPSHELVTRYRHGVCVCWCSARTKVMCLCTKLGIMVGTIERHTVSAPTPRRNPMLYSRDKSPPLLGNIVFWGE